MEREEYGKDVGLIELAIQIPSSVLVLHQGEATSIALIIFLTHILMFSISGALHVFPSVWL